MLPSGTLFCTVVCWLPLECKMGWMPGGAKVYFLVLSFPLLLVTQRCKRELRSQLLSDHASPKSQTSCKCFRPKWVNDTLHGVKHAKSQDPFFWPWVGHAFWRKLDTSIIQPSYGGCDDCWSRSCCCCCCCCSSRCCSCCCCSACLPKQSTLKPKPQSFPAAHKCRNLLYPVFGLFSSCLCWVSRLLSWQLHGLFKTSPKNKNKNIGSLLLPQFPHSHIETKRVREPVHCTWHCNIARKQPPR